MPQPRDESTTGEPPRSKAARSRRERPRSTRRTHVIAYDVSSDRAREKVARLIEPFGRRVGLSVFEVRVSPLELRALLSQIAEVLQPRSDRAQAWPQCARCAANQHVLGSPLPRSDEQRVVVI